MVIRLNFLTLLTLGVIGLITATSLLMFKSAEDHQNCYFENADSRIESAVIHWVPWEIVTRRAYSKEDVRRSAQKVRRVSSGHELKCLNARISKLEMKPDRYGTFRMNGRVLIEATMMNGERQTIFADQFRVCIFEQEICSENTEDWRSGITTLMESGGS